MNDRPFFFAVADRDLALCEGIKAFNARHIDPHCGGLPAHHVVSVDSAHFAEVVLRFLSVPSVGGYELLTSDDGQGIARRRAHNGILPGAEGAVAPEVGAERLFRGDLEADATAVTGAQVFRHRIRVAFREVVLL
jgi:hypothetical protein